MNDEEKMIPENETAPETGSAPEEDKAADAVSEAPGEKKGKKAKKTPKTRMGKIWSVTWKVLLGLVGALILVVGGYVIYLVATYSRIEDNLVLEVVDAQQRSSALPEKGVTYTVVTQNLGFGAYTQDFTFFMDGGTESWGRSKESVENCIRTGAQTVKDLSPDFVLFQEVDFDSDRSYHTDQREWLKEAFPDMNSVCAVNYHSAFLAYPFSQPHGKSNSSLMTFSRFGIASAIRRSLPISTGFSKFLDLDRCYSVQRIPVSGGGELVLYNVHASAYGGSDEIRAAQMGMLFSDMQSEYEKGNWCVCGGDFNHDFTGTSTKDLNGGDNVDFGWAQPFPEDLLTENVSRAIDYDDGVKPTCRNCDVPYKKGNFVIIVDGFLVTDNVEVTSVRNVETKFVYSDHNPVVMQFVLK